MLVAPPAIRVEKGWRGRRESDSQVTCHPIHCMTAVWHGQTRYTSTTSAPPPPPPHLSPPRLPPSHHHQVSLSKKSCTSVATLARICVCESKPWRVASLMMAARDDAAGGTSSTRQRRERRLRSWAKHERLSVAMALAEKLHHSAYRTVLPKKEVEQHYAPRRQKPATAGPGTTFSLAA